MRFPFGKAVFSAPPLLDTYTGASVAYSVRKLRTAYAGPCLRVRESGGNTETDIGFSGNNLDTASLAVFCAGVDGFVTKWYDQSGNANDAAQATAANQPKIVSAGSVLTINSKPALLFDGTNDFFTTGSAVSATAPWTASDVVNRTSNANTVVSLSAQPSGGAFTAFNIGSAAYIADRSAVFYTFALATSGQMARISMALASTVQSLVVNGSSISGSASGQGASNNFSEVGSQTGSSNYTNGSLQEVVLWTLDQTANITGINSNVNAYFSVY